MNCNTIYETALSLIGIPQNDASTEDYKKRALKLFPIVLNRYRRLSTHLCGIDHKIYTLYINDLNQNCPLDERTIPPIASSLAALLIMDELPELAIKLENEAAVFVDSLTKEAVTVGSIREVY